MASRLHSAATLCLWPPHERLTISTSEDNRCFLVQDVSGDGNCFVLFCFVLFLCVCVCVCVCVLLLFFVFFFFFFSLFDRCYMWGSCRQKNAEKCNCGYVLQNWELWHSQVTLYGEGRETKQFYPLQMVGNFCRNNGCSSSSEMSLKYMVKVTKGYSLQIFHPHGQPTNVFDIHLRNEHFQSLQPLAESSISSSSACQTSG